MAAPKTGFVGLASGWLAMALVGCTFGAGNGAFSVGSASSGSTASGSGSGATSAQWQGPDSVSTTPGSEVSDLEAASSEVLVAARPGLEVVVLGGASVLRESGVTSPVESLASVGSEHYVGCGDDAVAGSGDVYQRGAVGWQLVLDGTHRHAIVAALGNDLYAFEGEAGVTPRVSVLSAGTWTSANSLPLDCVPTEALSDGTSLWVGASPAAAGDALLFAGDATSGFTQVAVPSAALAVGEGERVQAMALDAQGELLVALEIYDVAGGQALRGRVLRYTAQQTFVTVLNSPADAPLSVAVQGTTVFVGTAGGMLLYGDAAGFTQDVAAPANQGVTRLLSVGSTLWVGVRTAQGADVYSRGVAGSGGTLGYADIKPALNACAGCHSTLTTGYPLSTGLGNDNADYTATLAQVDLAAPGQSNLLAKGSATVAHSGGGLWGVASANYDLVLTWIQQGANQVGTPGATTGTGTGTTGTGTTGTGTGTTPPPPTSGVTSYQAHIKPLLTSCVGCHATQSNYRLTAGQSDDQADYQATLTFVNAQVPDASPLLSKASNTTPHGGGGPWPTGSAAYLTGVQWIQGGTVFSGGTPTAPAPIPANPTYVTDVRPLLLTCATVGCHATKTGFRVTAGLTNNTTDYQAVLGTLENDAAKSDLLEEPTSTNGHPVKVFDVKSRTYDLLLKWIQQGAKFQ